SMQSARRGRGRPPYPDVLTPAEWSVLLLVRQGLTNREVARRRGTSVDAVRYHLENIAGKLGLDTREQLRHWDGTARGEGQLDLGRQHRRTRMTSPAPTPAATLTANASFLLVHDVARTAAWFRDTLGFTI